jgi:lipopolysaccharide biosynthesis glycosyltransferase
MIDCRLKLLTLEVNYRNIKINLVESEEPFVKIKHYKPNYYKIFLPSLIQKYEKLILLDWNTLVFEDLEQLYNLNLEDNYFLGFMNNNYNSYLNLNFSIDKSIKTNVLLINMKKLKENNYQKEFKNLYLKYKDNSDMNEEIMINVLYQNYIGILPAKYGMPNFANVDLALEYNQKIKEFYRYEQNDFISAYHKPIVMEYTCSPWDLGNKCHNSESWWNYAGKTIYYEEIKKKYGKASEKNE